MKKTNYHILGLTLFSSFLVMIPQVSAEETPIPEKSLEQEVKSTQQEPIYTEDNQLNQAISDASAAGITVIETAVQDVESPEMAQSNYQEQAQIIKEAIGQYTKAKDDYRKAATAYIDYQQQEDVYQKELANYKTYQKEFQDYQVAQKTYNLAKVRYDEDYNEAQGNIAKDGYLPEVLAQNLIFRSEPNASQTITGNLIPDDVLDTVVKDSNGWMDPGTLVIDLPKKTVTTKGRWNSVLMSIGDSVVVDYTDLENSSFSGYQLKKVRYTYKLLDTTHYSGKVIFQAIDDPTITSYTHIYDQDGVTQSSFEMEMVVQFFDAQGNEIIPTSENYALTSFASINSRNGQGEFVGNYSGQFLPINGSTITVQDNYALNFSDTIQESVAEGWDSNASPDAYVGAIVGKSTERISFTFGNSHGFADWFAFNSDIKVKGGIVNPPIPPKAPAFVAKPVAPKKVEKPEAVLTPIIFYHRNKVVPKNSHSIISNPEKPQSIVVKPNYPQDTHRPVSMVYTYATPNFGRGSVVTKETAPSYNIPHPEKAIPGRTKQTKSPKTRAKTPKDWFGENTGIKNTEELPTGQTDLIAYIKEIGQKAKEKYGNDKNKINRDIALTLASPSYSRDTLQRLYNTFKGSTFDVPENIFKIIEQNHGNGKIDFAHVMTTVASLESQKFTDELTKGLASSSVFHFPYSILSKFPLSHRSAILQQNSFVGDVLTTMPESDVYTDMDAIILAKHPKYKDLPMDDRILAYYGQENLDQKRKDLFLEVYGMNRGMDKGEAQLGSAMEILFGLLTVGGIGALAYSALKGRTNNIGSNLKTLDTLLYDGNLTKFVKNPVKTTANFLTKTVEKRIIKPIVLTVQKINRKVFQPTVRAIKNVVNKSFNAGKRFVTKTIPKAISRVGRAVQTVGRVINRTVIRPIQRRIRRIVQVPKRVIQRQIVRPVKRIVRAVTRVFNHKRPVRRRR